MRRYLILLSAGALMMTFGGGALALEETSKDQTPSTTSPQMATKAKPHKMAKKPKVKSSKVEKGKHPQHPKSNSSGK